MAQIKYTTPADVKAYPSVPDSAPDAFIDKLISRASAYIDKYTGRKFGVNTTATPAVAPFTVTDEVHRADNWGGFYLLNQDVRDITSVKVGAAETLYIAGDYDFDKLTSRFYLGRGVGDSVKISYTYGYDGIPDDIAYATEQLVSAMYSSNSTNPAAILKERTGNYEVNYASPTGSSSQRGTGAPDLPGVHEILKLYRVVHV